LAALLGTLLFGGIINDFDTKFDAASAATQEKYYNAIKHVYIQAIVDGDERMKYSSLTRLIKAAKTLGLDYEVYEKELSTLKRLSPEAAEQPKPKPAVTQESATTTTVAATESKAAAAPQTNGFSKPHGDAKLGAPAPQTSSRGTKTGGTNERAASVTSAPKSNDGVFVSEKPLSSQLESALSTPEPNMPVLDNSVFAGDKLEVEASENLVNATVEKSAEIVAVEPQNETKPTEIAPSNATSSDSIAEAFAGVEALNVTSSAPAQNETKNLTKPEPKASAKPIKKKSGEPAILESIEFKSGQVILHFDATPPNPKSSVLKGSTTRYIYDVNARKGAARDVNVTGLKDFRTAQFDKDTLRIVFESERAITIADEVDGATLVFRAAEFGAAPLITRPRKTIVIDAGHGGKDVGATSNKKYEKDVTLQIALQLGYELKKRGYTVYQTRSKDVYLKLGQRTKTANDKSADLFVSIHANAAPKKGGGTWQGVETFFLSPSDSKRSKNAAELENQSDVEEMDFYSKQTFLNFLNREKIIDSHKLAIDIQQYILFSLRQSYSSVVDGGVREAPFWVLTGAQMPAVLLEVGYITDKTDRERMFSTKFQKSLVEGISNGIDSYFIKNK
jgi:N-acetylmuramoyl-L-alanine amidase